MGGRVEYRGCTPGDGAREYALRVTWADGDEQDVVLVIANAAFHGAIRFQDGPGLSFSVLEHLLATRSGPLDEPRFMATEADLQGYRDAQAPKPRASRSVGRAVPVPVPVADRAGSA